MITVRKRKKEIKLTPARSVFISDFFKLFFNMFGSEVVEGISCHSKSAHRMIEVRFSGETRFRGTFTVIDQIRARSLKFKNRDDLVRCVAWAYGLAH